MELRHRRQRGVLRVDAELHPEAAADLGRDHADLVLLEPQQGREAVPHRVRRLGRRPDDQAPGGRVGRGHGGPPLERHPAEALAHHALADHLKGPSECGIRVAGGDAILVLHVPRRVGVDLRGPGLPRLERIAHRGQRLPVDDHLAGGVDGGRLGGRDHRGDRLADVTDPLDRQRVVLAADRRLARAALGRRLVDGHGPAVRLEVGAGHHRDDARAPAARPWRRSARCGRARAGSGRRPRGRGRGATHPPCRSTRRLSDGDLPCVGPRRPSASRPSWFSPQRLGWRPGSSAVRSVSVRPGAKGSACRSDPRENARRRRSRGRA